MDITVACHNDIKLVDLVNRNESIELLRNLYFYFNFS